MSSNVQFERALIALSIKFSGELPTKLREIQHLLHSVAEDRTDEFALVCLQRALHGLAAAANTFGQAQLTDTTRHLCQHVTELIQANARTSDGIEVLQQMLDELVHRASLANAA